MASTRLLYCFFLTNFLIVYMITRVNRIIESNNFFGNIHDVPDFSYLSYLTYLKQPSRPAHQIQKEKRKKKFTLFESKRSTFPSSTEKLPLALQNFKTAAFSTRKCSFFAF